ncbi:MAG TPA: glycosyltransferase 87 family protein [Stellaceae bacterium]|nr:glycosyltransferase 87 family protein [Stellaceae bacterium]
MRAVMLAAIGVALLVLTGIGLLLQHEDAHSGFIVLALVQGAFYLGAVGLTWRGGFSRSALVAILAVAALMRLEVLPVPPYLSDDVNRYVWDGRVEAAGINPYRYVPVDPHLAPLRDDAIFPNVNRSTYAPTIYPPVAEAIFLIATSVSESLTWMKATMVGCEVTSVALLLRLLGLFGLPRERILIYAWHPLALWEFAGSGHIDAAVITFVALALWARRREAAWLTGSALAAAALVKFFPAVIFPALYRRWDWKMPAAAAATALVAYLPFLGAGRSVFGFLPGYLSEEGLQSGSGFFLWNLLTSVVPRLSDLGVAPYLAFAAAALASLAIYAMMKDTGDSRYLAAAMAVAVATTVLLSPHYPWYFTWLVPFLCFRPVPSVLYLTVASPLLYFVPGGPDPEGARTAFEAAIYGPFALLACLELRHHLAARAGANWIEAQT